MLPQMGPLSPYRHARIASEILSVIASGEDIPKSIAEVNADPDLVNQIHKALHEVHDEDMPHFKNVEKLRIALHNIIGDSQIAEEYLHWLVESEVLNRHNPKKELLSDPAKTFTYRPDWHPDALTPEERAEKHAQGEHTVHDRFRFDQDHEWVQRTSPNAKKVKDEKSRTPYNQEVYWLQHLSGEGSLQMKGTTLGPGKAPGTTSVQPTEVRHSHAAEDDENNERDWQEVEFAPIEVPNSKLFLDPDLSKKYKIHSSSPLSLLKNPAFITPDKTADEKEVFFIDGPPGGKGASWHSAGTNHIFHGIMVKKGSTGNTVSIKCPEYFGPNGFLSWNLENYKPQNPREDGGSPVPIAYVGLGYKDGTVTNLLTDVDPKDSRIKLSDPKIPKKKNLKPGGKEHWDRIVYIRMGEGVTRGTVEASFGRDTAWVDYVDLNDGHVYHALLNNDQMFLDYDPETDTLSHPMYFNSQADITDFGPEGFRQGKHGQVACWVVTPRKDKIQELQEEGLIPLASNNKHNIGDDPRFIVKPAKVINYYPKDNKARIVLNEDSKDHPIREHDPDFKPSHHLNFPVQFNSDGKTIQFVPAELVSLNPHYFVPLDEEHYSKVHKNRDERVSRIREGKGYQKVQHVTGHPDWYKGEAEKNVPSQSGSRRVESPLSPERIQELKDKAKHLPSLRGIIEDHEPKPSPTQSPRPSPTQFQIPKPLSLPKKESQPSGPKLSKEEQEAQKKFENCKIWLKNVETGKAIGVKLLNVLYHDQSMKDQPKRGGTLGKVSFVEGTNSKTGVATQVPLPQELLYRDEALTEPLVELEKQASQDPDDYSVLSTSRRSR